MYQFFPSPFFNFEFTRVLGTLPYGGAELAECLDAAVQITTDDPESWHAAWLYQAEKAHAIALDATKHGDRIAARDAFLRAANYFRASQYMFNDRPGSPDARVRELSARSRNAFRQAIPTMEHWTRVLEIPYDGAQLPGYLFLPLPRQRDEMRKDEDEALLPVVVCINGADSTSEELYLLYGASGCQRGYAVLVFDGPGQGASLREGKGMSTMRPDWEVVMVSVLDYLEKLAKEEPGLMLDASRIALAGVSMGAYYALRGAVDARVSVCVAVDPFYDMFDLATSRMPGWFIRGWLGGWITDGMFDATWRALSRWNFQLKWELTHVMWIFGKRTPAEAMREMQRYSLKGEGEEYLRRVNCAVMISGAAQTIYTAPEISTLRIEQALDHLPQEKRYVWIAREAADGGLQGKVGAWRLLQQRLFQFLDEQWDVKRIEAIQG